MKFQEVTYNILRDEKKNFLFIRGYTWDKKYYHDIRYIILSVDLMVVYEK